VYKVAELAAADISAALSFGRTYKALQTGQCPQLDALKRCDRIFLNRAMDKVYFPHLFFRSKHNLLLHVCWAGLTFLELA